MERTVYGVQLKDKIVQDMMQSFSLNEEKNFSFGKQQIYIIFLQHMC